MTLSEARHSNFDENPFSEECLPADTSFVDEYDPRDDLEERRR